MLLIELLYSQILQKQLIQTNSSCKIRPHTSINGKSWRSSILIFFPIELEDESRNKQVKKQLVMICPADPIDCVFAPKIN